MNWSDKYLGMQYGRRFNCAALAALVAKDELGIDVKIPRNATASRKDQYEIIAAHLNDYVIPIQSPEDKQVVLMGQGHIGVLCLINNGWWVLHNDSDFGSVIRQRLCDIEKEWKIEGMYKWK